VIGVEVMGRVILASVVAVATVIAVLSLWSPWYPEPGERGNSEQSPATQGGGPAVSWIGGAEVNYDFSLYQIGTVYWTARVRFRNTGSEGRVSFTVTLEKEGRLVGYEQADSHVEPNGEYVLSVRGHVKTFQRTGPLTIYCPLTISSPNSESETKMDYVYLDSVSISAA